MDFLQIWVWSTIFNSLLLISCRICTLTSQAHPRDRRRQSWSLSGRKLPTGVPLLTPCRGTWTRERRRRSAWRPPCRCLGRFWSTWLRCTFRASSRRWDWHDERKLVSVASFVGNEFRERRIKCHWMAILDTIPDTFSYSTLGVKNQNLFCIWRSPPPMSKCPAHKYRCLMYWFLSSRRKKYGCPENPQT